MVMRSVLKLRHGGSLAGLGLSLLTLFVAPQAKAEGRWETLEAIHWVENPTNTSRPGPFGELGAYQFRRDTWKMHSRLPFSQALNRQSSDEVAVKHYEWLRSKLLEGGLNPSTYNIAMAWNAGPSAVLQGTACRASRDYAARVNNLAAELKARQVAAN